MFISHIIPLHLRSHSVHLSKDPMLISPWVQHQPNSLPMSLASILPSCFFWSNGWSLTVFILEEKRLVSEHLRTGECLIPHLRLEELHWEVVDYSNSLIQCWVNYSNTLCWVGNTLSNTLCWVNYNNSLTWIVRPFGDDSPINYDSRFRSQWGRYNLPRLWMWVSDWLFSNSLSRWASDVCMPTHHLFHVRKTRNVFQKSYHTASGCHWKWRNRKMTVWGRWCFEWALEPKKRMYGCLQPMLYDAVHQLVEMPW